MTEAPHTTSGQADLAPPAAAAERRVGWLLGAAAVTAIVTLILVLTLGLQRPPELAPLADADRPEHALAILSYRDGARGQCLDVVTPEGELREVRCSRDGLGTLVGWDERGIIVMRYVMTGERIEALDPVTGTSTRLEGIDPRALDLPGWSRGIAIDREAGRLVVRDDDGAVRWSVEVGDGYRIENAVAHPADGALIDNAGRLLLLAAGSDEPRVWVEDLGIVFGEVVWEGTALTTD